MGISGQMKEMSAAERRDSGKDGWRRRQERMRYEVLAAIYRGCEGKAGCTLVVSAFAQGLSTGEDGLAPLSPRSAARTVVAVRGLHRFLALEGTTTADPAEDVHPPTAGQRLPKAIHPVDGGEASALRGDEAQAVGDGGGLGAGERDLDDVTHLRRPAPAQDRLRPGGAHHRTMSAPFGVEARCERVSVSSGKATLWASIRA